MRVIIKRNEVVENHMRLTGTVNINGSIEPVNWTIVGSKVISGSGLSADNISVMIPLPSYLEESAEGSPVMREEAASKDAETGGYWDKTVTDLRLLCKERGLAISGNKTALVERLQEYDSSSAPDEVEETTNEVNTDDRAESSE